MNALNYGNTLYKLAEIAQAADAYFAATKCNPNLAEAWNNLGVARSDLGQIQAAKQALRTALVLRPNYAEARENLDDVLRRMNDEG